MDRLSKVPTVLGRLTAVFTLICLLFIGSIMVQTAPTIGFTWSGSVDSTTATMSTGS